MSQAERNRKLINDYFDAWAAGDVSKGESYWADDFVGFQAGHSELAGTYHGAKDFHERWIAGVLRLTNGQWTVKARPEILLSGDDGVVIIAKEYMIREGKGRIDTDKLVVYTIQGEKIKSCRMYDGDQGAIDDFWS
jgi:ketosteroid isomerase-like protein